MLSGAANFLLDIGPRRRTAEVRSQISYEMGDLLVGQFVGEARHERARPALSPGDASQDRLNRVARRGSVHRRTRSQRRRTRLPQRGTRSMATCTGPLVNRVMRNRSTGRRRSRRRLAHQGREIDRDRAHILDRRARQFVGDFAHRTGSRAMARSETGSQVVGQGFDAPRLRAGRCGSQRRRVPAFGLAARERPGAFFRPERIERSMAGAAMAESFYEIGAAIPLGALRSVRRPFAGPQKQEIPAGDKPSNVQRENDGVGRAASPRPAPASSRRRRAPRCPDQSHG